MTSAGRPRSWLKLVASFLAGVTCAVLAPILYVASGGLDLSQTKPPGRVERELAGWALQRSLAVRGGSLVNPAKMNAATLDRGLHHYRENCVVCHGAPHDVEAGELAKGMQPPPPALDDASVQRRSDAQLFWIVRAGIRFSAMPAFGPTHDDEEIWQVVTFVRHLPELSEREASMLRGERPATMHHHGQGAD
jgi:mono/diheme cytochrome c family protein